MIFPLVRTATSSALAALALLALGMPASAQILNGSFETDAVGSSTITDWNRTGSTYVTNNAFGDNPTDETQQAFLNNDPQATLNYGSFNSVSVGSLESFLNLSSGSLDSLGNGTVTYGSGISQTFTLATAGTLSFDYDFVTSEDPSLLYSTTPSDFHKDFAFVSLTGAKTVLASIADSAHGQVAEPAQTGRTSPSIDDYLSETGYETYSINLSPGQYTLGLGVVNVGSSDVGSGLLVDNAQFTPVPEVGTGVSLAILLSLGGFLMIRRGKSGAKA